MQAVEFYPSLGVFMSKFVIRGARPLTGEISVSGSKNAALPILFASLTVRGDSYIYNLPDIGDVRLALGILESFGVSVRKEGDATVVNTDGVEYCESCRHMASRLRASTYLIGACLARFGRVRLMDYGGCNFQNRPIDIHMDAAEAFGASECGDMLVCDRLKPSQLTLRLKSVGATVNSLILAASAEGTSTIKGAASEPHIDALIDYLVSAGAEIQRYGDTLTVKGRMLEGARATVPPDMIEAGSFLALSALFEGVRVKNVPKSELYSFLFPFFECGVHLSRRADSLALSGLPTSPVRIITEPYPGFPTDLQPISSVLLAKGRGGTVVERVWKGRFGYLSTLGAMGVTSRVLADGAEIFSSDISSAAVTAPDLRGGAAAMLLALTASGESVIENADVIKRGYENPEEKLRAIGADIEFYD